MNGKNTMGMAALAVGGVLACAAALYPVLWRRRCLTWGTTGDEAARTLPGDDLMREPDMVATRAITIQAPPGRVWPWLVQMGTGRGGAYTYDWVENLFGLDMHSADTILPEFQHVAVGDELPVGANGPRMRVTVVEPERAFVVRSTDGRWVWAFVLEPVGDTTRLTSRNRIATPDAGRLTRLFNLLVMEPGSLVMERKMLLGIKQRAERTDRGQPRSDVDHATA
jgi:hypothetical protein